MLSFSSRQIGLAYVGATTGAVVTALSLNKGVKVRIVSQFDLILF